MLPEGGPYSGSPSLPHKPTAYMRRVARIEHKLQSPELQCVQGRASSATGPAAQNRQQRFCRWTRLLSCTQQLLVSRFNRP